ncbi:unnamed protein product [Dracunculus medinensis]|uniref:PBPe domain-containing protein n=1 Tax=Dracunculus medinensis TaxID=318479 RepID=A0A0N4UQF3_DRAME|nr:unnamed protein product [Dracunculus medinensis]
MKALFKNNLLQFGEWSNEIGWKYIDGFTNLWQFNIDSERTNLEGITLRIVVHLEEPFVMQANNELGYEGYCIDLLLELSKLLRFNFTIFTVSDGTYGIEDSVGRWNGIVGALQRREADMSISAITITYSRIEVIDFTLPFMHLGISVLLAKDGEEKNRNRLFTFLEPLSFSVWISLLCAYLAVSVSMWLLAKFSSREWFNVEPINGKIMVYDNYKNQFNMTNSLWFAVGSLMQQGSDVIPRAAATRIVAITWWLFTLILLSSYTAQLAAFLTVERMTTTIENTADLAGQHKIKYGTLKGGSTMNFFRESKIPIYERMWSVMESNVPTVFVNSSKEGIERVKAGNYAYIMESTMIEYYMERDCDLQRIDALLDSKGYGIALPKGSPLRNLLSQAILKLQERTILEALKNKWWKDKRVLSCSATKEKEISASSFENIIGIFYVLCMGVIVAFLLAVTEFFLESRNETIRTQLTILGRKAKFEEKKRKFHNIQLDTTINHK